MGKLTRFVFYLIRFGTKLGIIVIEFEPSAVKLRFCFQIEIKIYEQLMEWADSLLSE